ncbi:MAG: hypothetical protein HY770_02645, partial [Chitinivibrionia bacterium]|nr:hypothetical protein [Chitinivibrionia bacterium]
MNKISTFEFEASIETLRETASTGSIPQILLEPMQSLATPIIENMARRPAGVYLFSSDRDKELRDLFGFCIARALLPHAKTTLLVDCDFLAPGLSGIVPQRDSLGFLDLLLYGSSMKAIVQRSTGSAFVVGTGSFQVTKKLPFSMDSFRGAARYLLNHAQCVVFSGPADDDGGELHPMAGAFESVICVRTAGATGDIPFTRLLEKLSALEEANIFVANVVQPQRRPFAEQRAEPEAVDLKALEEIVKEPAREPEEIFPLVGAKEPAQAPPGEHAKEPAGEPAKEPAKEAAKASPGEPAKEPAKSAAFGREAAERRIEYLRQRSHETARWDAVDERLSAETKSSFLPKAALSIVAVILVAFIFWWLFLTKPARETKPVREGGTQHAAREAPATAAPIPAAESGAVPQRAETTAAGPEIRPVRQAAGAPGDTAKKITTAEEIASTAARTTEQPAAATQAAGAVEQPAVKAQPPAGGRIELYEDLTPMAGTFLIHISSFRALAH